MSKLRDAAQQALEALKKSHPYSNSDRDLDKHSEAIHALRSALAEPPADQEPVAWIDITDEGQIVSSPRMYSDGSREERPLYTSPQPTKPAEQGSVAAGLSEELRYLLVAISEAIADQDDRAAQAILRGILAAPQPAKREPLTDEEIDNTTRKQVDDLLDHIYEYGTATEGIDYRVRAIARAIERAHGIGEHE